MQTFVPYAEHHKTALCLDRQRLGKQRVETLQILNALNPLNTKAGWKNHPAVKMWAGHEQALIEYGLFVCHEWVRRGYQDTCAEKIKSLTKYFHNRSASMPDWWGDSSVHDSHKSKLLQKDFNWYQRFQWDVPLNLEYHWPTN